MRWWRILFAAFAVTSSCLFLALADMYSAWKCGSEPQVFTTRQFLDDGPGSNSHIKLSEFQVKCPAIPSRDGTTALAIIRSTEPQLSDVGIILRAHTDEEAFDLLFGLELGEVQGVIESSGETSPGIISDFRSASGANMEVDESYVIKVGPPPSYFSRILLKLGGVSIGALFIFAMLKLAPKDD